MRTKEEVAAHPGRCLATLIQAIEELHARCENDPYLEVTNQWYADQLEKVLNSVGVSPKKTRNFLTSSRSV